MYLFIMMRQDFVSSQNEILILFYVSMLNIANLLLYLKKYTFWVCECDVWLYSVLSEYFKSLVSIFELCSLEPSKNRVSASKMRTLMTG